MGCEDLNALERVESEKIRVTGNDVCCPAAYSKFKELVVFRITTRGDPRAHIHPLDLARQRRKEPSDVFLIDIAPESFPAQNFIELDEHFKRQQDFSIAERQIEGLTRF